MDERRQILQSALDLVKPIEAGSQPEAEVQTIDIPGWRVLDDKLNWKQCPIGVFHS